jgi:lipopolysaccharide heptosyltransferase II
MRALIVKIGALGDVVMTLPMVSALRPVGYSHVSWLCGKSVAPLLEVAGAVDEVIAVDDEALFKGGASRRLRELSRLWARLARAHFDLVITAHGDWRYRLLTLPLVGCEHRRLGAAGLRPLVRGRHHSNEYVRLVTRAEGPEVQTATLPTIKPALPRRLSALLRPGNDVALVALAPGGARNILRDDALRRWPLGSYAELAGRLAEDGMRVVVTGGATDGWVSEAFRGLPVVDLVGKTTVVGLLGVYAACDAVVTHDSGPLHLAQLARVPIIALFGPTTPSERVLQLSGGKVFWGGGGLACRPCYDGRGFAPCSSNVCLQEIGVESVHAAIMETVRWRRGALCRVGR